MENNCGLECENASTFGRCVKFSLRPEFLVLFQLSDLRSTVSARCMLAKSYLGSRDFLLCRRRNRVLAASMNQSQPRWSPTLRYCRPFRKSTEVPGSIFNLLVSWCVGVELFEVLDVIGDVGGQDSAMLSIDRYKRGISEIRIAGAVLVRVANA